MSAIGVKRTSLIRALVSANDPKRTLQPGQLELAGLKGFNWPLQVVGAMAIRFGR